MASSAKISGVTLPGTIKAGNDELDLNGAGVRKKLMMKTMYGSQNTSKGSNKENMKGWFTQPRKDHY